MGRELEARLLAERDDSLRQLAGSHAVPIDEVKSQSGSSCRHAGPAASRCSRCSLRHKRSVGIAKAGTITCRRPDRVFGACTMEVPPTAVTDLRTARSPGVVSRLMSSHWSPIASPRRRPHPMANATNAASIQSEVCLRSAFACSALSAFGSPCWSRRGPSIAIIGLVTMSPSRYACLSAEPTMVRLRLMVLLLSTRSRQISPDQSEYRFAHLREHRLGEDNRMCSSSQEARCTSTKAFSAALVAGIQGPRFAGPADQEAAPGAPARVRDFDRCQ